MTNWVRLWEDMPTDPKWRVIAKKADVTISEVIAVFTFMLVKAADPKHRGRIENWCDEDVAEALNMDANAIERIRTHMNGKVLQGSKLTGWEARQPMREDGSADRARKWREKQKQEVAETERNRTQPNAIERPDTDKNISTNVDNKPREPSARDILLECLSEKTVSDLIAHRQAKRAKLTPRAARELVKAFTAFGDAEAAAAEMILRGWTGFKPDWMVQATSPPGSNLTAFGGKPRERDLRNVPDNMLSADDYWKKRKQQREWA